RVDRDRVTLGAREHGLERHPLAEHAPAAVVDVAYSGADLVVAVRRQILLEEVDEPAGRLERREEPESAVLGRRRRRRGHDRGHRLASRHARQHGDEEQGEHERAGDQPRRAGDAAGLHGHEVVSRRERGGGHERHHEVHGGTLLSQLTHDVSRPRGRSVTTRPAVRPGPWHSRRRTGGSSWSSARGPGGSCRRGRGSGRPTPGAPRDGTDSGTVPWYSLPAWSTSRRAARESGPPTALRTSRPPGAARLPPCPAAHRRSRTRGPPRGGSRASSG